jgi:hypothetical protein
MADSISIGTLTIGAGSKVTINAIPGGQAFLSATSATKPVPEPAAWVMLMLAFIGLGFYWRSK